MNEKFCVNEKTKCFFLVISFLLLISVIFLYWKVNILWVSANPDYICVKNVTNMPCVLTNYPSSCSEWTTSWTRTCPWVKTTQVSYYLIRTSCEAWYSQVANGEAWWASWRNSADYVSGSQNCTITETDTVPPTWEIN